MVRYAEHSPYIDYYVSQARGKMQTGGSLPSFAGTRFQKGHGLANIFKRMRAAIPSFFKTVGRHFLRSALGVGDDLLAGRDIRQSAPSRFMEGVRNAASDVGPTVIEGIKSSAKELFSQSGRGKRKRGSIHKNKKKRKKTADIFQ